MKHSKGYMPPYARWMKSAILKSKTVGYTPLEPVQPKKIVQLNPVECYLKSVTFKQQADKLVTELLDHRR